jgi:hypothetical protein
MSGFLAGLGGWLDAHFLALKWAAVGAAAAVPLVVLLYFLKLKRKEQVVSSTLLWRRALEDLRVNAPFQRLRASLLLLLQVLLLLALAAALARPFLPGLGAERKTGYVFLLDCSASMATRDCSGRTRLEAARQAALEEADRLPDGALAAVVSFAARPRILCAFTANRAEVREAISGAAQTGAGTDLSAALMVADGMAGTLGRDGTGEGGRSRCRLAVFSDAALPENRPVTPVMCEDIDLRCFGGAGDNMTVTSLEARRVPGTGAQVFARVANLGPRRGARELRVFVGSELSPADVRRLELEPGERRTVIAEVRAGEGEQPVRAELSAGDALGIDDTAWTVLPADRRLKVLGYTDGDNFFLDKALSRLPAERFEYFRADRNRLPESAEAAAELWRAYDAVVFDRCSPTHALPPAGGFLFLDPPALPGDQFRLGAEIKSPRIIDWDRSHPLVSFAPLEGVAVLRGRPLHLGRGQVALLEAQDGPLIAAWGRDQLRVLAVGFDVYQSNWPLRLSFPVFMANAARWLSEANSRWAGAGLRCGEPFTLQAAAWPGGLTGPVAVEVVRPDGAAEKLELLPGRPRVYAATEAPGVYRVRGPGGREAVFGCAVLDEAESDNSARPAINFAVGSVRGASWELAGSEGAAARGGREIWKYLAAAALAVMMLEWYVFNRRLWT